MVSATACARSIATFMLFISGYCQVEEHLAARVSVSMARSESKNSV